MKIRQGFVSNSSSSSFLIIGTKDSDLIQRLAEKDNFDGSNSGYGFAGDGDKLMYYGNQYDGDWDSGSVAGLDGQLILEMMTLPQARVHVQKIFQSLGVDVDEDEIDLHYGEMSSE
jgi:hypothetical protein